MYLFIYIFTNSNSRNIHVFKKGLDGYYLKNSIHQIETALGLKKNEKLNILSSASSCALWQNAHNLNVFIVPIK